MDQLLLLSIVPGTIAPVVAAHIDVASRWMRRWASRHLEGRGQGPASEESIATIAQWCGWPEFLRGA